MSGERDKSAFLVRSKLAPGMAPGERVERRLGADAFAVCGRPD